MEGPTAGWDAAAARADVAFHARRAGSYDRDVTADYDIYDELALIPWLDAHGVRGAGTTALDAGAGTGAATVLLAGRGVHVDAVDHSPAMLAVARERASAAGVADRIEFHVGDIRALPFADGAFDVAVCQRVLHHLERPEPALAELRRVLAPGGRLCFSDTIGDATPAARLLRRAWGFVLRLIDRDGERHGASGPAGIVETFRSVPEVERLLSEAGFRYELRVFTHVGMRDRLSRRRRAQLIRALSRPWRTSRGDVLFAFATTGEPR